MTMTPMSKAGRRRFNSQAAEFRRLLQKEPALFRREWKKRVLGWLYEIHRRARNWSEGTEFRNTETVEGLLERGRTHVFGVVECAERFTAACGRQCEDRVGIETRAVLKAECVTAVARVIDRHLNRMTDHKNYRGAKNRHPGANRA